MSLLSLMTCRIRTATRLARTGLNLRSFSTVLTDQNLCKFTPKFRNNEVSFSTTHTPRNEESVKKPGRKVPVSVIVILASFVVSHFCYKLFKYSHKNEKHSERPEVHKIPHSAVTLVKCLDYWFPVDLLGELRLLEKIQKFQIRDSDILVASFPKSGTTWIQEIVYLIINDLDLEKAAQSTIEERFPYLEWVHPGLKVIETQPDPRLIKTHLPMEFLPDGFLDGKGKVIYIARNPKDVSVSYFHFMKMMAVANYRGEFSDFYDAFKEGKVGYGPWTLHVSQYWRQRERDNVFFLTYEELHKKPKETMQKLATFLGKPKLSDQKLEALAAHCSFSKMKDNPMVNYAWWEDVGMAKKGEASFMRKGKIGDWKNCYSDEMDREVNRLMIDPLRKQGLTMDDRP